MVLKTVGAPPGNTGISSILERNIHNSEIMQMFKNKNHRIQNASSNFSVWFYFDNLKNL